MTVALAPSKVKFKLTTGKELAEMGDIGPSELLEGEIIPTSPIGDEHGGIEVKISVLLYTFVSAHKLGKVRSGEVGIYIQRNPDTIRAADVLYISNERYAQKTSPSYLDAAPELIVEIMSPNDRWSKVVEKLRDYFAIGVNLVWLVDPKSRSVYAYRALTDVREFAASDDLTADDVLPGFSVKVSELFE